ncbi:polysaccharide pyruvyl transferase CsaB [Natranaerofaba carboxydovora]|uniref:polysaccharide pyruvyl transferase CsaB n=1 Tax=Natranaerofaba carboxydovora TaxID=2742683 RepID=UPI001F12D831|nr:polysaccharide pyruvyl transferase CsaB [Natranaerofaba carboxydovora]UMZ75086.1 Polysaccharide pyruvyl transferase [Natranaerofaba carboxydovora]
MTTKVVFSGYYGSDNIGDEALIAVLLKELNKRIKDFKPVVISNNPAKTSSAYEIDAMSKTDIKNIIKELKSADLLISGGGSLLQDVTGKKTIPYYLGIIALAKILRVPVFFCAQGVGPVNSVFFKKAIKYTLNRVDAISVRDEKSKLFLESLGVKKDIHYTADLAYLLYPNDKSKIEEILSNESLTSFTENGFCLGVSIRPWKDNKYIDSLIKLLKEIKENYPEYNIIFIPFKHLDDLEISQYAMKKAEENNLEAKMIKNNYTPEEVLGIISEMDILIGVRLHSLIFSAIGNTLPLGISYDPKVDAFLEQLELDSISDIDSLDYNSSFENIERYLQEKTYIKKEIKYQKELIRERAAENIDLAINLIGDEND